MLRSKPLFPRSKAANGRPRRLSGRSRKLPGSPVPKNRRLFLSDLDEAVELPGLARMAFCAFKRKAGPTALLRRLHFQTKFRARGSGARGGDASCRGRRAGFSERPARDAAHRGWGFGAGNVVRLSFAAPITAMASPEMARGCFAMAGSRTTGGTLVGWWRAFAYPG